MIYLVGFATWITIGYLVVVFTMCTKHETDYWDEGCSRRLVLVSMDHEIPEGSGKMVIIFVLLGLIGAFIMLGANYMLLRDQG